MAETKKAAETAPETAQDDTDKKAVLEALVQALNRRRWLAPAKISDSGKTVTFEFEGKPLRLSISELPESEAIDKGSDAA